MAPLPTTVPPLSGPPTSVRTALRNIAAQADDAIDLVDAAFLLAAWADPGLDLTPYQRHVDALCAEAQAYLHDDAPSAALCAEAVRQIVSRRYGYGSITESDEPAERGDGANLARVIDKRRGDAVSLCILYHQVLQALGVTCEILAFAPRALVRIEDEGGARLVLDPSDNGRAVDARALRTLYRAHRGGDGDLNPFDLTPLSRRTVLIVLQDQIKVHHLRMAAPEAALVALEAALLIAPDTPRLWREMGLLHARMEHIGDAISALQHFLDLPGGDAHRYTASELLQQLQSREDKKPS